MGWKSMSNNKTRPNKNKRSSLDRAFFENFLDVLNLPQQSAKFNFTTQFPYHKETLYIPDLRNKQHGDPLLFDMDMSAGDFLALIYLLKVPVEVIDLKGILVSVNGWANAATIDIIYDVLHMMGRDDIPVGLGNITALGTAALGCEYLQAIPHGSGGFLDSDTLFGLARNLPRSPRRYTAQNSVKFGAPRNTDNPELRQPLAIEVWQSVTRSVSLKKNLTILTNGPLTNLANIILSDQNAMSIIKKVYIVGGHVNEGHDLKGNVFTITSNQFSEFNMFLDPLAAKTVLQSDLDITLIPLNVQQKTSSFSTLLNKFQLSAHKTPEMVFSHKLLSLLHKLQQDNKLYRHMDIFLGEILGAVFMADHEHLDPVIELKNVDVLIGNTSIDGQLDVNKESGKPVKVLHDLDAREYYSRFVNLLGEKQQSAVIASFDEQSRIWSQPPSSKDIVDLTILSKKYR